MNFDFLKDGDEDDGTIRINTARPRARPAKARPPAKPGAAQNLASTLLAIAILGGCTMCVSRMPEQTDAEFAASDQSILALYAAQRHIKPMLKAPASAKWPGIFNDDRALHGVQKLRDGTYLIRSFVDSQNDFGAMIRTWYVARVRVHKSGGAEIIEAAFVE